MAFVGKCRALGRKARMMLDRLCTRVIGNPKSTMAGIGTLVITGTALFEFNLDPNKVLAFTTACGVVIGLFAND